MGWSNKRKRGRPVKLESRTEPCQRVIERRELYAWLTPTKGPDGRGGTIDQDICDGIGQLHALGLLDGHGIDAQDLRDKGREWRNHLVSLLRKSGFKTGSYQRMDKARHEATYTARDERFDELDNELRSLERWALYSLLVDPIVGSYPDNRDNAAWVEAFICEALLTRKKHPPAWMQPVKFPDAYDRNLFDAAVRGLCLLASDQRLRRAA